MENWNIVSAVLLYIHPKMFHTNDGGETFMAKDVRCEVESCKYYCDRCCEASHIQVNNCDTQEAMHTSQTACDTFELKK